MQKCDGAFIVSVMTRAASRSVAIAATVASVSTVLASPVPPAEGSLARWLFGPTSVATSIKFDGYVQAGFVRNDATTSLQREQGLSNYPIAQASDEGFLFNGIELFLRKDIDGNIVPRVGPRPTPKVDEISWGFMVETQYGRNGQAARSFGFDDSLGINHPGDQSPRRAAEQFQNFLAFPNFFAQLALPFLSGEALTIGRFAAGVGYEKPVQTKSSPDFFYSRSYAYVASPIQVTGATLSINLGQGTTGVWVGDLGVVNGWQNWRDNNDQKSILGALRWRATDFKTGANFSFITGDEQNEPGVKPQLPNNRVLSPRSQRRTHLALNGFHDMGSLHIAAEVLFGKQEGDGQPDTILLGPGGGPRFRGATYCGINVHVAYQVSDQLTLGARGEQFKNPDGFALFPTTVARGTFDAPTIGAHYDVSRYLRLRPEIRYDNQSDRGPLKAFGNGRADHQTMVAVDALLFF